MRRNARFLKVFGKSIFVLAIVALTNPQVAGAACGWQVTGLPGNLAPRSVAALAANDVWMLSKNEFDNGLYHWNGLRWTQPALPTGATFLSISGTSDHDLWLAGRATRDDLTTPVSEHYDGRSWSVVPVPYDASKTCSGPPHTDWGLNAIRSFAPNDVWALEIRCHAGSDSLVAIRWDGSRWSDVSLIDENGFTMWGNATSDSFVSASSDHDIWVVGNAFFHFDGQRWSIFGQRYLHGFINSVYADSPTDAWAVGNRSKGFPNTVYRTYTWHWDGVKWSEIQSPNHDGGTHLNTNVLDAVSGTGPNDVWAVGGFYKSLDVQPGMALHWDGHKWSFASPKYLFPQETLTVSALAPNVVWAFGYGPYAASYCR